MSRASVVDVALRCYPAWWKERYADEVRLVTADLETEGCSTILLAADLMRGAIRARTRAEGMPEVERLWAARTRLSIAAATLPWLVAAPLVLITMGGPLLHASGGRVVPLVNGPFLAGSHFLFLPADGGIPRSAPPLTPAGTVVIWAGLAVDVLFFVTLAVLAVGWNRLTTAVQRSPSPHSPATFFLAWAPGFAFLGDLGLFAVLIAVQPSRYYSTTGRPAVALNGEPALAHALLVALVVTAIGGWLLSVAGVAVATRRADIAPADLRFGRTVSVVVSALLAALLVAYTAWGLGLVMQAHQAGSGAVTTIMYPDQALWLPMVLALAVATLLATTGARVAVRSWKMAVVLQPG